MQARGHGAPSGLVEPRGACFDCGNCVCCQGCASSLIALHAPSAARSLSLPPTLCLCCKGPGTGLGHAVKLGEFSLGVGPLCYES